MLTVPCGGLLPQEWHTGVGGTRRGMVRRASSATGCARQGQSPSETNVHTPGRHLTRAQEGCAESGLQREARHIGQWDGVGEGGVIGPPQRKTLRVVSEPDTSAGR